MSGDPQINITNTAASYGPQGIFNAPVTIMYPADPLPPIDADEATCLLWELPADEETSR